VPTIDVRWKIINVNSAFGLFRGDKLRSSKVLGLAGYRRWDFHPIFGNGVVVG
jgi:hypothetical protein